MAGRVEQDEVAGRDHLPAVIAAVVQAARRRDPRRRSPGKQSFRRVEKLAA
jgi:hypothetical protein